MNFRALPIFALMLASAAIGQAATIVYDNTSKDSGDYTPYGGSNQASHLGDTVTLAGTNRSLTGAQIQLFNNSNIAGTYDATLYLWQVGSPVGNLIGSSTRTGIQIDAFGFPNVDFTLSNLTVPDTVIFTVAVSNVSTGLSLGMGLYVGPTVGSSDNTLFILAKGSTFFEAASGSAFGNHFLRLTADPVTVPEPSTISMAFGATLMMAFAVRRRKR